MDEATALQTLKQYGVPPTPENMQRVMMQAPGSDGSAVLGRSMGLQGGMDESGNALDKLAFASQRSAPVAAPVASPSPMPTAPVASAALMSAPVAPPRQAMGPQEPYGVQEPTSVPMPTTNAGVGGDSPFMPWLLAALGLSSVKGRGLMAPGNTGGAAAATGQALLEGPEARARLASPTEARRIEGPNPNALRLEGPRWEPDPTAITYQPRPEVPIGMQPAAGAPTQEELYGNGKRNAVGKRVSSKGAEAVDKISESTTRAPESRRPVNTNADQRNSEPSSKPVNLDTKAPVTGVYDGEPTNLVEEIAKFLKKTRR